MAAASWLQLVALVALVAAGTRLLGPYLASVYDGSSSRADKVFGPVERVIYRVCGIDEEREQRWTVYATSVLAFSLFSVVLLYALQRVQGSLPLNPDGLGAVPEPLAWNTAVSFVTNTNWQNYAGETTMSHLTQMVGLAVQNFVSPVVGLCVAMALVRGLSRRRAGTIGNFWVDLVRGTVRVMLPLSVLVTLVLVSQGAIQNFHGFTDVRTLQGAAQAIPGGPFASQEAVKMVGTNGGGTLNANSMHPLSNTTGFTNLLQIFVLLLIPFALTYAYGKMVKDRRQGWVLFATMMVLWLGAVALATGMEVGGNPELQAAGVTQEVTATQGGGNLEGKEVRFGSAACGVFAASTTGTSTGAVNCAHDSMTPLGGHGPAGRDDARGGQPRRRGRRPLRDPDLRPARGVHRRPDGGTHARVPRQEDPGRGDEARGPLHPGRPDRRARVHRGLGGHRRERGVDPQPGPPRAHRGDLRLHVGRQQQRQRLRRTDRQHRLVQHDARPLDAHRSLPAHRADAGRSPGSLARKQRVPVSAGTFPTGTPLFAGLLTGVILIVVGLTYFPVLALGPIVEHLGL